MEAKRAIAILKTLVDGVDPRTGAIFPMDSPYQDSDVVRALYAAIDTLGRGERIDRVPANVG